MADAQDLGLISESSAIEIKHCHDGDAAAIHVIGKTEGWFKTTNSVLALKDLSMIPDGTNTFEIQSLCEGRTGAVRVVSFNLKRPPPAPKVLRRSLVRFDSPPPPIPPGLVMALPGGTNVTYADHRARLERAGREGRHRSQ